MLRRSEWPLALVAALVCVATTIVLAAGHVGGSRAGGLGAAIFILTAVWCLTERRAERTLVVFALYVGLLDGYLKLRTGNREMTLARDVLLWAIAAGALWRAVQRGDSLRLPPLGLLVVAFVLVIITQLANPSSPDPVQSFAGVRQHLEFVPLFFLGYALVRTPKALKALLLVLVLVAAVNGAVSYVQSTLTPAQLASWGPGYSERVYGTGIFLGAERLATDARGVHVRPFGLGSDAGAGAVIAALALPALIALLLTASGGLRLLLLGCAPAVALGISTSGSRAALVACAVSMLAFVSLAAVSRNALRAAIGAAVAVALMVGVMTQLGASNDTTRRAKSVLSTGSAPDLLARARVEPDKGRGIRFASPARSRRRHPSARQQTC